MLHLLGEKHLDKLFEILLYGRFDSPSVFVFYSIIYLYRYGLKDIYTWVVIQYYFLCSNCFSFSSLVSPYVPFTDSIIMGWLFACF